MKTFLRNTAADFLLGAYRLLRSATSETGILFIGWLVLIASIPVMADADPAQVLPAFSEIMSLTMLAIMIRAFLRVAFTIGSAARYQIASWRAE